MNMKHLKKLTMTLALASASVLASWAQDEYVTVNPTANANEWTFTMPGYDVELEVEYETALALNEVDDNTAKLAEWNGYEADVTLTRTLAAGSWNTLAVPFNVSATTIAMVNASLAPNSIAIKKLTSSSFENGTLTLNFEDANEIEAGTPYLVKVPTAFSFAATPLAGIIMSNATVPTTTTYVDFIPTLGKTTIEGDDATSVLFLAAENTLKNPDKMPTDMKGFRGYFLLKGDAIGAARSFSLNLVGTPVSQHSAPLAPRKVFQFCAKTS